MCYALSNQKIEMVHPGPIIGWESVQFLSQKMV
jgi:hypothetical protein